MNEKTIKHLEILGAIISVALVFVIAGCATTAKQTGGTSVAKKVAIEKAGAQLWTDNCMHCHNLRPPTTRSDAGWEVNMLHMRVRANLTAEESKKILEFLKSAN